MIGSIKGLDLYRYAFLLCMPTGWNDLQRKRHPMNHRIKISPGKSKYSGVLIDKHHSPDDAGPGKMVLSSETPGTVSAVAIWLWSADELHDT